MELITIDGFKYFLDRKTRSLFLDCEGYEKCELEDFSESEITELNKILNK